MRLMISPLRRIVRHPARMFRVPGAVVSAAPVSDSSTQLFRTEALTEYQTHWLGTVLLTPRRSDHFFAIGAILAVVAILALLIFGGFTRKARVNGWLVPQQGLVRGFAPQPG